MSDPQLTIAVCEEPGHSGHGARITVGDDMQVTTFCLRTGHAVFLGQALRNVKPEPGHERTEAERLKSAEITLVTISEHAEQSLALPADVFRNDHARGYENAMRDVQAILDARWLPEGAPVVLNPEETT